MKTIFVNLKEIERTWYLIDAEDQVLGRVAAKVASVVRGKESPRFAPHHDTGDRVVVINADKFRVTGTKLDNKVYHRHSGYPGGLTTETLRKSLARKPLFPLERAIKGMLPKGSLGRKLFTSVRLYAGTEHPHKSQNPVTIEL